MATFSLLLLPTHPHFLLSKPLSPIFAFFFLFLGNSGQHSFEFDWFFCFVIYLSFQPYIIQMKNNSVIFHTENLMIAKIIS